MTTQSSSSGPAKEKLHALIESISDEHAQGLLDWLDAEHVFDRVPLTTQQVEQVRRRLASSDEAPIGRSDARRRFGLPD